MSIKPNRQVWIIASALGFLALLACASIAAAILYRWLNLAVPRSPVALSSAVPITTQNVGKLEPLYQFTITGTVQSLAWSPDARWLALGTVKQSGGFPVPEMSVSYSLRLWDIVKGNGTVLFTSPPYIGWFFPTRVAFSPDGKILIYRTQKSTQQWNVAPDHLPSPTADDAWKISTGRELPAIPETQVCVTNSPDDSLMAVENYVRENDSGKTHILNTGSDPPACVAFSPDGRFLAIAAKNGIVQLWGVR